jgi:hypothetical protein
MAEPPSPAHGAVSHKIYEEQVIEHNDIESNMSSDTGDVDDEYAALLRARNSGRRHANSNSSTPSSTARQSSRRAQSGSARRRGSASSIQDDGDPLDSSRDVESNATVLSSAINMITNVVGAGLLTLPWAMRKCM